MKYLIPILLLPVAFFLNSCATSYTGAFNEKTATYDIGMEEIERPADIEDRYGEVKITKQDSADVSKYVYSDSLISITWIPLPSRFHFVLENNTDHTMKLVWDEAVFVDPDGGNHRVTHSGVKYADANSSKPPSIIIRNGTLTDMVLPADNISWGYSSWIEKGIFEPWQEYKIDNLKPAKDHIGKKVTVLLPLEIEGNINEYLFTFKVNNVELPEPKSEDI